MEEKRMNLGARFYSSLELDKPSDQLIRSFSTGYISQPANILQKVELEEEERSLNKKRLNTVKYGGGYTIGHGRFATIFRVEHQRIDADCCVKMYSPQWFKKIPPKHKQDRICVLLDRAWHPALMRTFDVFEEGNRVFRLMEQIPLTLFDYIMFTNVNRETGVCGHEKIIKLMLVNVISALEYLHYHGIVHGCLHYKNIFVDHKVVKISDLENCVFSEKSSFKRTPLHLLPFVAPELHQNRAKPTHESDIWSLGVCLYTMSTKSLLFEDTSFDRIVKKMRRGLISPPFRLPAPLQTLLRGMLCVKPVERLTIEILSNDSWILSAEGAEELLERQFQELHRKTNGSIRSEDGYATIRSAILKELATKQPDGTYLKKKALDYVVYIQENNRENDYRVESCIMQNGKLCVKLFIPEIKKKKVERPVQPSRMDRIRHRLFNRPIPSEEPETDLQVGDYALMSFGCNGAVIEKVSNYPTFTSRTQAHSYVAKKDARRLWRHVEVETCSACVAAGCDSGEHTLALCTYHLLNIATHDEEIFNCTGDDMEYMRMFTAFFRIKPRIPSKISRMYRRSQQAFWLTFFNGRGR